MYADYEKTNFQKLLLYLVKNRKLLVEQQQIKSINELK
jgi:hypothetical protein